MMIRALACLFLAALAGAQTVHQPQFYGAPGDWCTSDAMFTQPQLDLGPDCYARWIDHAVRHNTASYVSALMPLVKPLPLPSFTFTNSASATWVVLCDKDSKNCKLGLGYTLDDVIAIYKKDCIK